jgi:hypothetical protein
VFAARASGPRAAASSLVDIAATGAVMRRVSFGDRQVVVECWEVRAPGHSPWASELPSEHEAREELRCAQRRGLVAARLYAISEDGVRYEVGS